MVMWKPERDPDKYPITWHEIVCAPVGGEDELFQLPPRKPGQSGKSLRNQFNAFKACLRAHPWHPTTARLAQQLVSAFILPETDIVMVKKRDMQLFIKMGTPRILK